GWCPGHWSRAGRGGKVEPGGIVGEPPAGRGSSSGQSRGRPMTEVEWLTGTDPRPLVEFVRGRAGARGLRLFVVACCRELWHLLPDRRSREAVEVAEEFADGAVGKDDLQAAHAGATAVERDCDQERWRWGHNSPEWLSCERKLRPVRLAADVSRSW